MTTHLDYITGAIEKREKRLAAIDQERVTVAAELGAYREMLVQFQGSTALMPEVLLNGTGTPSSTAFQMSPEWTAVLRALDIRGKSFAAVDVIQIAKAKGFSLTMASVRSQFSHYTKRGYFRKVARGKYVITPKGREKFGAAGAHQGDLLQNQVEPLQGVGGSGPNGGSHPA